MTYTILALDHRNSLRKLLNPKAPDSVSDEQLIDWKILALENLLEPVSHVLVDPQYGLEALNEVGVNDQKVILSLEKSGYTARAGERLTELQYGVQELIDLGADVVKLLIYYHPQAKTAARQLELVCQVAADCRQHKVPFLLEPKPYAVDEADYAEPEVILQTARDIMDANCPINIYKCPFPGENNCQKLTQMLKCPWVLLSGGDSFDIYKQNLKIAVHGGCSGFAAGRALWQEFNQLPENEWAAFFQNTARKRLEEIVKFSPWT